MGTRHLTLVDADLADRCGGETRDGSPCLRKTGGERCHDHEDAPSAGEEAPEYLGEYGREEWERRMGELASANLLDEVDLGLLESLCDVYHEVRASRDHIDEHGRTISGRGGSKKKNPAHSVWMKARKEYRMHVKDLRDSLPDAVAPEEDDEGDGWGESW